MFDTSKKRRVKKGHKMSIWNPDWKRNWGNKTSLKAGSVITILGMEYKVETDYSQYLVSYKGMSFTVEPAIIEYHTEIIE